MIRLLRDFRFIPIALIATSGLLALKLLGLAIDGGYTFDDVAARSADDVEVTGSVRDKKERDEPVKITREPPPKPSWAHEMFNFPDITGSVAGGSPPPQEQPRTNRPSPQEPSNARGWVPVPIENEKPPSPAERAILERLQERRNELEARNRDLDMRENLIKAAEKRIEARIAELKDLEARVAAAVQQKDESEAARFKNLITMYENMKAKDAAKIFDRLDLRILVDVATQLNPRRMSDILAQMTAESAEHLTVELATRAANKDKTAQLPKIEGRPTTAQ
jgi:flagellar motility protein MotE (MotC chaperone)